FTDVHDELLYWTNISLPDQTPRRKRVSSSAVEHNPVKHLIHGARGLGATGLTHDPGRHAGDRDIVGYRFYDDRAGSNARAMANFDIAENLCAGADHYAAADFRVAVLLLLSRTAQRHIVQERHVVLNDRGFTHHNACSVIEEYAAVNFRRRIDIALKYG